MKLIYKRRFANQIYKNRSIKNMCNNTTKKSSMRSHQQYILYTNLRGISCYAIPIFEIGIRHNPMFVYRFRRTGFRKIAPLNR